VISGEWLAMPEALSHQHTPTSSQRPQPHGRSLNADGFRRGTHWEFPTLKRPNRSTDPPNISWSLYATPFRVDMLINSRPWAARCALARGYYLLPFQGNER
jgi:hypothetical protein